MALDAGVTTLNDSYDATHPIKVGSFRIGDFHGKHRVLTVPEVFIYSSNIGTAKMALDVGLERHKAFLRSSASPSRLRTELPENAMPLVPRNWTEITSMTVGFGHGISVSPLHLATAGAASCQWRQADHADGSGARPGGERRYRGSGDQAGNQPADPETDDAERGPKAPRARPRSPDMRSAARPDRRKKWSTGATARTHF